MADWSRWRQGWLPRSVWARLTLGVAVTVALIGLGSGLLLGLVVHSVLVGPIKGEARARAAELVTVLGATPGPSSRLATLAAPWPTVAQIADRNGRILAASAELDGMPLLLAVTPQRREPTGQAVFSYRGRRQRWQLDGVAATRGGEPVTVVVATSLAQADGATRLLAVVWLVALPSLVGLAALTTWSTVGRALRPVSAMSRQVGDYDPDPGGRGAAPAVWRVAVPATDDEFGRLAATFNGLLDRLAVASDRQRRFVADASHELRSPIANVAVAVEIGLAYPDVAPWPEIAADVLAQNQRMAQLVRDLLVLAKADAGLPATREPVDLAVVVEETLRERPAGRVPAHRGRLAPVTVLGDPAQLGRVVENLIDNAVRHAAHSVVVELVHLGHWAELTVRDDGSGVPAAEQRRIFERFVRLDSDRSRDGGGAGLGLAIVAEVLRAHGGTVSVGDAAPGAVFTVRLPAASFAASFSGSP